MQFVLTVTCKKTGTSTRCDLLLNQPVVLGRHMESPVALEGVELSRRHVLLSLEGDFAAIQDLSSNGTWLNGIQLRTQTAVRLRAGDILEIPGYEMQIEKSAATSEPKQLEIAAETGISSRPAMIARTAVRIVKSQEFLLLGCIVATCVLLVGAFTS